MGRKCLYVLSTLHLRTTPRTKKTALEGRTRWIWKTCTSKKKYRVPLLLAWHTKVSKKILTTAKDNQRFNFFCDSKMTYLKISYRSCWSSIRFSRRSRWILNKLKKGQRIVHPEDKKKGKEIFNIQLTVGHPVSAIYMVGLFVKLAARSTSVCWKNSYVQAAESWTVTSANHGCTLAI